MKPFHLSFPTETQNAQDSHRQRPCAARRRLRHAATHRGCREKRRRLHQPVCLLKTAMPVNVKHRVVGPIESSKEWYGSQTELYPMLADEARKVGADVVAGM